MKGRTIYRLAHRADPKGRVREKWIRFFAITMRSSRAGATDGSQKCKSTFGSMLQIDAGFLNVANGRDRREPVFDAPAGEAGELDFRLSPEDRAGGTMARRRASQDGGDGPRRPARPKKAKRKGGRSFLSKLVYAGLVLVPVGRHRRRRRGCLLRLAAAAYRPAHGAETAARTSPSWQATARFSPIAARRAGARCR